MGLQDTPVMSAVSASDVLRTQAGDTSSARSGRTSGSSREPSGAAPGLEEGLLGLTLREGQPDPDQDAASNTSEMDYQRELEAEGVYDDPDEDDWDWDTEESRLSRALRSWMSHYRITPLPPQLHTAQLPVFSARLGRDNNNNNDNDTGAGGAAAGGGGGGLQRASSTESLDTQLSLFSCSSHGSRKRERKRRRVRRKKVTSADGREGRGDGVSGAQGSRWEVLAKRTKGELDRFMMAQSHALSQNINLTEESEAFQLCEVDEQRALYSCGQQDKLEFAANLKKSDSLTNIRDQPQAHSRQHRVASAGKTTFHGKPLDFQDLRRQMLNQRLAALTAPRRLSGRRSLHRTHSRLSLNSVSSSDGHAFFTSPHPRTPVGGADTPPHPTLHSHRPRTSSQASVHSVGREGPAKAAAAAPEKNAVNMWKGDAQILAIDLKRELTSKVKRRIAVTTSALERVTGIGDDNEQRPYSCHLPEFPSYVDEDFAHQPKIPQKIRIAPHLSDVIKSDIKVRMGRPRYHEIRVQDLAMWSRGQTLDRTHRNLKVFNWLHSLKEDEFEEASLQQTIHDEPPDADDFSFGDMVLIRAADEPEIKPLYEQKKTYIR